MSRVRDALKLGENRKGMSVLTGQAETVSPCDNGFEPARTIEQIPRLPDVLNAAPAPRPAGISRWVRRWRRRLFRTRKSARTA